MAKIAAADKLDKVIDNAQHLLDKQIHEAKNVMDWQTSFMIVRFHFVHMVLGIMTKVANPKMETMGVRVIDGGRFELSYSPEFVLKCKDAELTFVLYHEIMHIALHHCTHRRFDDSLMGNYATDLAVNELVPVITEACEPPKDESGKIMGLFVSELKKQKDFADIEPMKSSEWYYEYLRKKQKEGKGGGKGKGKAGEGKDKGEPNDSFDEHGGWKEDEIADERVRAHINSIEKQNQWGTMPATHKEMIIAAQTRKINWRNLLRQFYGNMSWHDRESTRKRPNRRTGYIHPGHKHTQVDRHLVAIDTSGSVDSESIAQFLSVINNMIDFVPIDLAQFSCILTAGPVPFDRRKTQIEIVDRGGTCFDPVMKLVDERKYKSVVILTDGCAPAPTQPSHARVVWVLLPGCKPPVEWGMQVMLDKFV